MNNYPPLIPRHKGFQHQDECLQLSWDRKFFALLLEMGTGKTKIAIDTIAGLWKTGQLNGVLILAPKGVYLNWMYQEIPEHMPDEVDFRMVAWSSYTTRQVEHDVSQIISPPEGGILDIYLMNIEAINGERGMYSATRFLESHHAMTIIDESTCIKSPQADRTKKAMLLGRMSYFRRIMTGTPITRNPLDLFTQFQFLQPGCLRFSSFTAFRAFYAQMVTINLGTRSFPKIVGFRNLDMLTSTIQPHSYRKLKSECLDLPEKVYETQFVELSPEQRRLYDKLKDEAILKLSDRSTITVTSALTLIMRLQQIACGHVGDDDGVVVDLPNSRLDALIDTLDAIDGKVLIWGVFRHDIICIKRALTEKYGPMSVVTMYGDDSQQARQESLRRFHAHPECLYFVGTPATGGRGLSLIEATTTIYYSNGYNLEHRIQSEDRNHRIGQKNEVTIIDLVCKDTVDERIVKIQRAKVDLAGMVLDHWREILTGEEDLFPTQVPRVSSSTI